MSPTADQPIAFTKEQVGEARHLGRALRRMAGAPPRLRDPAMIRHFEDMTGLPADPFEVILFCDSLDGVLAGRDPAALQAELVRKIEAGPAANHPEAITFEDDPFPIEEPATMSTEAEARERRRQQTQARALAWQEQSDGTRGNRNYVSGRTPEAVGFTASATTPAATPPPAFANESLGIMTPMAPGVMMPAAESEPETLLGFTDAAIEAAERLGLDPRGRAALELAGLPAPGSAGVKGGYSDEVRTFHRNPADLLARRRAILRRVAEGRPVDGAGDAVDLEVAAEVVPIWYLKMGLGVEGLEWRAPRAIDLISGWEDRFAASLLHAAKYPDPSIATWCDDVRRHDADRRKCGARVAAIRASMEALPSALAASVGSVVDGIGGAEKLIPMIREAAVRAKAYPGPDVQLDQLRRDFDEADTLMKEMCPPSGEEPGELFATASARRDELLEAVKARKVLVEKAASDRIREGIAALLAGGTANHTRLLATVRSNPEAFPDGFGESLDRAGLYALMDSGALGWLWCL